MMKGEQDTTEERGKEEEREKGTKKHKKSRPLSHEAALQQHLTRRLRPSQAIVDIRCSTAVFPRSGSPLSLCSFQSVRLISLATQKFIAEVAEDSMQYSKQRNAGTGSSSKRGATVRARASFLVVA